MRHVRRSLFRIAGGLIVFLVPDRIPAERLRFLFLEQPAGWLLHRRPGLVGLVDRDQSEFVRALATYGAMKSCSHCSAAGS